MPITLELKDLQIGYNKESNSTFNYHPINVAANNNELIALIGRNGAGKSTLLRTLARLQPELGGHFRIEDRTAALFTPNEFARHVSFIPSEPVYLPHTTVYDFVSRARYPYHGWFDSLTRTDRRIIQKALNDVGIAAFRERYLTCLSDGERQRVMIAFAIAQDTPIILMDEPTAFLDLPNKFELVGLLREQTEQGKTVILSTHDLQTAFSFVDTIWMMLPDGLQVGAPEDSVLTDTINRLMQETPVRFDSHSGQFNFTNPLNKHAVISGGNSLTLHWTGRALARIGYATETPPRSKQSLHIEIIEHEGKVQWCLSNTPHNPTFDSLRDLCLYLKAKK